MLVNFFEPSATTASGTWSGNTPKYSGVEVFQFLIVPATATNIYDIALVDNRSRTLREFKRIKGRLDKDLRILLRGIATLSITNASLDEAFTVFMSMKEAG